MFGGDSNDAKPPGRPSVKVRDLGREIMRKANHCTWIGYMTEEQSPPLVALRGNDPTRIHRIGHRANMEAMQREEKDKAIENSQGYRSITNSPETRRAGHESTNQKEAFSNRIQDVHETEKKLETLKNHREPDVYEKDNQMEALKNLQAQQVNLMEQQRMLQVQIQRQMESQESGQQKISTPLSHSVEMMQGQEEDIIYTPVSSPNAIRRHNSNVDESLMVDMVSSNHSCDVASCPSEMRQKRRLKGNLAEKCAIRDEGSLGSLIWSESTCTPEAREKKNQYQNNFNWSSTGEMCNYIKTSSTCGKSSRCKIQRRPEGSAMNELLRQSSSQLSNASSKTAATVVHSSSDSSGADTIMAANHQ